MEVFNLVSLLTIAICIMVVATDSSCSLEKSHPDECMCVTDTLLCSKQRETEPSFTQISRDVRELTITGYKIKELNTTRLLGGSLTNLRKLDLSNNKISTVSSDSFWGKDFPVLQSLILGNNDITFRYSEGSPQIGAFHNLSSLIELDLNNSLKRDFISSGNFTDLLDQSKFVLRKLVLSGNKMSSLSTRLFTLNSTRYLEELYLSGNALTNIQDKTFSHNNQPNLTLLDLSRNRLDVITNQTVENLKTLNKTRMYLGGNPFQCNCDSVKFIYWIKDTDLVEDRDTLECHNLENTLVLNVDSHQIKCASSRNKNNSFTKSQYIILCVIFAIIGFLALIILFMRRKDIVRFCMQVRQATKEAFDSHQTHYTYSDIQNARRETADSGVASVDV